MMTEKMLLLPVFIFSMIWNALHPVSDARIWKEMQAEYAGKKRMI